MLPKVQVRPKGPPFGFFFGTMRLFSKIFEIYQRVPPWLFLKFSVCRKRWMSLNGLFLSFSALCDLKNTFFRKKSKIFFWKKFFFQIFPIVVPWIFLSLRYGADLGRSRLVYYCCESRNFIEISRCLLFSVKFFAWYWIIQIFCSAVTISVRIKFLKLPTTFQFSCDRTSEW